MDKSKVLRWLKSLLYMIIGVGIGVGLTIVIYILGGLIECGSCLISCGANSEILPYIWDDGSLEHIFIFCGGAGAIIGLTYGIIKAKLRDNKENAEKRAKNEALLKDQHQKWANMIRSEANNINQQCKSNASTNNSIILTNYVASLKYDEILRELVNLSELQGKVDSMADKLEERENLK